MYRYLSRSYVVSRYLLYSHSAVFWYTMVGARTCPDSVRIYLPGLASMSAMRAFILQMPELPEQRCNR